MALTERDIDVVLALNRYRLLRTSQVKSLVYSSTSGLQVARRRLRLLFHNGYVKRIPSRIEPGNGTAEDVYRLDEAGEAVLRRRGEEILSVATDEVKAIFVEHALAVSHVGVSLELALRRGGVPVELERFAPEHVLRKEMRKGVLVLEGNGRPMYPDALILLRGRGPYQHVRRLFLVEADRGTESSRVVLEKLAAYHAYRQRGLQKSFGEDLDGFRLLFVTASAVRVENLVRAFKAVPGGDLVLLSDETKLNERTILEEPIWTDVQGRLRPLLRQRAEEPVREKRHAEAAPA